MSRRIAPSGEMSWNVLPRKQGLGASHWTGDVRDGSVEIGKRRNKLTSQPMQLSGAVEDLQVVGRREATLLRLTRHLRQKREEDILDHQEAAMYLFHSCKTMVILFQEVLCAIGKLSTGRLTARESRRVGNVLTTFQSFAANSEIRREFIAAHLPSYLIPLITSKFTDDDHERLRAVSLSIMGLLCQAREGYVIKWALQSGMVAICTHALECGSEPSKVIAIQILECLLQNEGGLRTICHPDSEHLPLILKVCKDLGFGAGAGQPTYAGQGRHIPGPDAGAEKSDRKGKKRIPSQERGQTM